MLEASVPIIHKESCSYQEPKVTDKLTPRFGYEGLTR